MTQIKPNTAQGVEKAIVLFGLGDDGKPQAGLFAATEAALAKKAAKELRLYILDCGTIAPMDPKLFSLTKEEIHSDASFVSPCYLVVHPKGTLIWDVGQVPDDAIPDDGTDQCRIHDVASLRRLRVPGSAGLSVKVRRRST